MKILGVNISHHPSICVYEGGKIISFYNEERFVLSKGYSLDETEILQSILQKINFKPDMVCYSSYGRNFKYSDTSDEKIIKLLQDQLKNPPYFFNEKEHHLYHAVAAFYFSSFKTFRMYLHDAIFSSSSLSTVGFSILFAPFIFKISDCLHPIAFNRFYKTFPSETPFIKLSTFDNVGFSMPF